MDRKASPSVPGVLRDGIVDSVIVASFAVVGILTAVAAWLGAPELMVGILGLPCALLLGVALLRRSGRELWGRALLLLGTHILLAVLAVAFGPALHLEYFLIPGIGMPFLFIGRQHRALRWGLSLVVLPLAVGVIAAQSLGPPLVALDPGVCAVVGRINELAVLLVAGSVCWMFTLQADAQLARIQRQQEQLRRKNAELDDFTRVVSHDLKTPAGAIIGLVDLMKHSGRLSSSQQELLDLMDQTAHNMSDLIHGLLQHARLGGDAPVEVVALHPLVSAVLQEQPRHGLRIVDQIDRVEVMTRPVLLRQVLANLLSNAIKYHDKADGTVWVRVRQDGGVLDIEVEDDGPGIPASLHAEVFRLFGTANRTARSDSSGIGLATVQKLVGAVGGEISLRSSPDEGACFRVRWPLSATGLARVG